MLGTRTKILIVLTVLIRLINCFTTLKVSCCHFLNCLYSKTIKILFFNFTPIRMFISITSTGHTVDLNLIRIEKFY